MRRNVLLVIIDQFRADLLAGDLAQHVDLPHLKGLMSESVVFDNHFTVSVKACSISYLISI